ncbi:MULTISPECIES: Na+/H+ antiporter NhaC [Culturomica]|jgi:NhaC family Na+:H+ antiporter|uniref:Na+/H+ antiporter NhaC n=1 Tax=Culturomica TaxID=1926651 RepID=UPI00083970FA|nr:MULTISPECIES: Na+/H+ antiporter NhaC [Odoribacteraceae]RHV96451.1 Na+/H+ antiporter NhaC [Odoribacter sp. OF09-27XD]HBO26755.1 Na+/H+ antiporter NhaC [Culturomica sp.]
MTESKSPSFIQSLLPVLILIVLLFLNVKYFEDPIGGANQIALFIAAIIGGLIGWHNKVKWENMQRKIVQTIHSAMTSILILLLIGALSGAWMISGVIPMMIYYGVDIMHPSYFLLATVILCSIVSLATGSSWSTIATVGVAIIGIGNAFGLNPGLVAGAIISGAYFGDKMSPLSDTTNLAPAIAGTDLFTHIRYMIYTTGPTMILTLVIFAVIGLFHWSDNTTVSTEFIKEGIAQTFHISPFLLIVPLALIIIIIKKVPPIPAMICGTTFGILFALLFQGELLNQLITAEGLENKYQLLTQSVFQGVSLTTGVTEVDNLLTTNGMAGMLNTVWLIMAALTFGGVMEACGFLKKVTQTFLLFITNQTSLVGTTIGTCIFFNITACDQYLAIVIPGKMLQKSYQEKKLKPEVLSRALEDSATMTSVLVPWNSCGATHSKVLGVATLEYLPFCFFNLISPLMNIFITAINYKIRKLK